jgi:hypothetical protein
MATRIGVEPERLPDRVQDLWRRVAFPALFQPGVLVDAHPGEHGDLFAAEPGDPAVAVGAHAHVGGIGARAMGAEELPKLVPGSVRHGEQPKHSFAVPVHLFAVPVHLAAGRRQRRVATGVVVTPAVGRQPAADGCSGECRSTLLRALVQRRGPAASSSERNLNILAT